MLYPVRSDSMKAKLMTYKECAIHLGVSYSTVRRMVAAKKIRIVRPLSRPMIPATEVAKFTFPGGIIVDDL
jgi:excisionase family DNA binding protein